MTEQEQVRALAELDGYKWSTRQPMQGGGWMERDGKGFCWCDENYLTSYDAIIPLRIKVCNAPELRVKWLNAARVIVGRRCPKNKVEVPIVSDFDIASIQPHEDCEALLRATGKWNDQ